MPCEQYLKARPVNVKIQAREKREAIRQGKGKKCLFRRPAKSTEKFQYV